MFSRLPCTMVSKSLSVHTLASALGSHNSLHVTSDRSRRLGCVVDEDELTDAAAQCPACQSAVSHPTSELAVEIRSHVLHTDDVTADGGVEQDWAGGADEADAGAVSERPEHWEDWEWRVRIETWCFECAELCDDAMGTV